MKPRSKIFAAFSVLFMTVAAPLIWAGPYSSTILADNPFAFYQFGETSGSTAANSGSGGSLFNGVYSNVSHGATGYGDLGADIGLNGINAYVSTPQSVGAGSFSVEGWINTSAASLTGWVQG